MLSGLCEAAEAVTVVTWRPPVTRPDAPPEAVGIKTQVCDQLYVKGSYTYVRLFSLFFYFSITVVHEFYGKNRRSKNFR